jgi:rSAM/selenodomain-associated transferase 1
MTRVPLPGQTKTRLMTHFTGEECASLHRAFLEDLIILLTDVVKMPACIFFTPCDNVQPLRLLVNDRLPLIPQEGETLGERMAAAIRWGLAQEYEGVLVVGSDLPTLPANVFHQAVRQLEDCDVVLGPTLDGGYYLVGARGDYPGIFQDIAWGTRHVFDATMCQLKRMDLKTTVLIPWNDVDTFEDLQYLKEQLAASELITPTINHHTRTAVKKILGEKL